MSSPFCSVRYLLQHTAKVLRSIFQTSHFVSKHLIVRILKLLTMWNVIYTFKRNSLLNRIIQLTSISQIYWDSVYFSYPHMQKAA